MPEWMFAQHHPSVQLCKVEYYSMKKRQKNGEVEFLITVKEYETPPDPEMKFFAQTYKQTNQKTLPFTPSGWGHSTLDALTHCLKEIERFSYEGDDLS